MFAAASTQEPQALFKGGNCDRPVTFATNKLVLLVPKGNPAKVKSVYTLRKGGFKLAVGSSGVPIGDYTRTLLRRLGLSARSSRRTPSATSRASRTSSRRWRSDPPTPGSRT